MQRFLIAAIAVGALGIAAGWKASARAAEATWDAAALGEAVLFEDQFDSYRSGPLFSPVGAHAEYHYVREIAPAGPWAVSAFSSDADSQRAWNVRREDGRAIIEQRYRAKTKHTHPTLVAGDEAWTDYVLTAEFAPGDDAGLSGVSFRYQNDRCYYWFGVDGRDVILKKVEHERDYHVPDEAILAQSRGVDWRPGEYLAARIAAAADRLEASLAQGGRQLAALSARDATYPQGRVALVSDVPARYRAVRVTTSTAAKERFEAFSKARAAELAALEARNPRPVLWKKIRTTGFGVGRNLRFGDLNGDGQVDVLIGQVVHHGPKDRNSELGCLTAMTFDGQTLWQVGEPDAWKDHLTNDVAFQIHDLDGDGRNEVIYCRDFEIVVADGATGKTKYKAPTPKTEHPQARYDRILGDSLFFCDIRGTGHPGDVVIKDRYWQFWVLNDRLELLWRGACNTGHYPYAADVDGDGKDELAIGYSLFDDDGRCMWTQDDVLADHADGVAIVRFRDDLDPVVFNAASDEGMVFSSLEGRILKHLRLGHVQNPAVADLRPDLPGLELVSINFWGNQGILHFYTAEGEVYHSCEPNQYGSMCLPINWTGTGQEYFVHSPNVVEGGMFDGWGRRVVSFPDDGHPDQCNAVLDVTGDCRDEVVVWDPYEIWVYTQDDQPKSGRLYRPKRNPLHNYSNYQATVSLPGWSE